MIIIIDPGHGGKDPGACAGSFQEKDQTLEIAQRLKVQLSYMGIGSKLTREKDEFVSLDRRVHIANSEKAGGLFISVHLNASSNHAGTGFESYRALKQENSGIKKQSEILQREIHSELAVLNKKYNIKDRGMKQANFKVLRGINTMPAILIELLFIDSDMDKIINKNYYTEVATTIATAIRRYIQLI